MTWRHLAFVLSLIGALLGSPTGSIAQEQQNPDALRRHIEQAVSAVKSRQFTDAAHHYLAAHAISPRPILLYNAAYALGRAGRLKRALDVSDRARESGLEGAESTTRNTARRHGWSMALTARERADRMTEIPSTAPAEPRSRSEAPPLEWIGAGTMVAGLGLFAGAGLLDAQIGREADRLAEASREGDRAAYDRSLRNVENLQRGGRILLVGGGLLVAGGATMTLWGLLDEGEQRAQFAPRVPPGGGVGLQWSGEF